MSGLHPMRDAGRINGLQQSTTARGRHLRLARRTPISLLVAGLGVYAVALMVPLLIREINTTILAGAVLGIGLFLGGLHLRWSGHAKAADD